MSNEVLSGTLDDRFDSETSPSRTGRRTAALPSCLPSAALGALGGAATGVMVGVLAGPEGSLAGALIGGVVGAAAAAAVSLDQRERRIGEELRDAPPIFSADDDDAEQEPCAEEVLAPLETCDPSAETAISRSATERYDEWSADRTAFR
jgi:hypothetical protein